VWPRWSHSARDKVGLPRSPAPVSIIVSRSPFASSKDASVVQERLERLPKWLVAISQHPTLSLHPMFRRFLALDKVEAALEAEAAASAGGGAGGGVTISGQPTQPSPMHSQSTASPMASPAASPRDLTQQQQPEQLQQLQQQQSQVQQPPQQQQAAGDVTSETGSQQPATTTTTATTLTQEQQRQAPPPAVTVSASPPAAAAVPLPEMVETATLSAPSLEGGPELHATASAPAPAHASDEVRRSSWRSGHTQAVGCASPAMSCACW